MSKTPVLATCTTTLKLLADFWQLRIIAALASGPQRFCDLQRTLGNVNPATLTKKLSVLKKAGFISRNELPDEYHVSYALSPTGIHSLPVLAAIEKFSASYQHPTARGRARASSSEVHKSAETKPANRRKSHLQ